MTRPLAIDLFCGLGGWTDGLHDAGYYIVGFDIERHVYGEHRYPGQLVIQDVLTLHGSQFKGAALIVASPPCQEYSYMAMPWKRAKAKAAAIRADKSGKMLADLNRLFDACFRIQREACEAAGQHIPLVVENVRGAQEWVGRARWNFGSYYLWGDVPALMPAVSSRAKLKGGDVGWRERGPGRQLQDHAYKSIGMNWSDPTKRGQDFTRVAGIQAVKNSGGSWFNIAHNTTSGHSKNPVHELAGIKIGGINGYERDHPQAFGWKKPGTSSHSKAKKFASAMIAKIPFALSSHIARSFLSQPGRDAA